MHSIVLNLIFCGKCALSIPCEAWYDTILIKVTHREWARCVRPLNIVKGSKFSMDFLKRGKNTPERTAFTAALLTGILTHVFALINVLHNFDDIASQPGGYGGGVSLGRWMLEIIGRLAERSGLNYNLPVVNGIVFIILLSIAAGFAVSALQVRKNVSAALIGMLFVVFPTVSATLFYRFTAHFYGIGILLSVLSVWVLRRHRLGILLSALLLCCSMGIYQAYVPIAIGLMVLLLIQQALQGETDAWGLLRSGLYDCAALLLGLLFYFLCMKISVLSTGAQLGAYQGIETMGQLSLGDIPGLIVQAFGSFCDIAFQDYCGVSGRKLIQLTYRVLGMISGVMIGYILLVKVKKITMAVAIGVLCLLFPIAVNFIVVMCPGSWIYTLMVYSFVLVACLPVVVAECLPSSEGKHGRIVHILTKGTGVLVAFLVFCYGYYDNVNYSALYYANRQVENYVSSIVTQVRMTESFTPEKQWALIGEIEDPLLKSHWDEEAYYGGNSYAHHLLINYSRNEWFENYIGYSLPLSSEQSIEKFVQTEEVKAMPCWPSEGSIKVIGDTVVIKFQELSS